MASSAAPGSGGDAELREHERREDQERASSRARRARPSRPPSTIARTGSRSREGRQAGQRIRQRQTKRPATTSSATERRHEDHEAAEQRRARRRRSSSAVGVAGERRDEEAADDDHHHHEEDDRRAAVPLRRQDAADAESGGWRHRRGPHEKERARAGRRRATVPAIGVELAGDDHRGAAERAEGEDARRR